MIDCSVYIEGSKTLRKKAKNIIWDIKVWLDQVWMLGKMDMEKSKRSERKLNENRTAQRGITSPEVRRK